MSYPLLPSPLRTEANQNAGNKDTTITFNLGSSQKASTIVLNSALPTVTADSTVIDTGGAAIVVTGAYFGPRVPSTTVGLTINGTHCVVRGLTITSFPGLGLAGTVLRSSCTMQWETTPLHVMYIVWNYIRCIYTLKYIYIHAV